MNEYDIDNDDEMDDSVTCDKCGKLLGDSNDEHTTGNGCTYCLDCCPECNGLDANDDKTDDVADDTGASMFPVSLRVWLK